MKLHISPFVLTAIALFSFAACGQKAGNRPAEGDSLHVAERAEGDSTIYGLACDGCTDSVVVFLNTDGGDPDTFDIIDARLQHQIFGKPRIGDQLALLINPEDSMEALRVIDLENLKGSWCYLATPQMRDISSLPKRVQRRMMANMPDSVRQQLLVPKEFGFQLKNSHTARPIGMTMGSTTTEDQSPVEYPPVKMYTEWRIFNGRLILTEEKLGTDKNKPELKNDTAELVMLMPDTLVLRFSDGERGYYRKSEK